MGKQSSVHSSSEKQPHLVRQLGLFDCTMIVMGGMIGSGIFIVPAGMSRTIGSPGWLIAAWVLTSILTIGAAATYGELSSALPEAGGMYRYLRECFSPLVGFLYGWTFFTVIQTGSIAAVAVAFARFLGFFFPSISEHHYLIHPIHFSEHYAVSLSTAQLIAILVIVLLSGTNAFGLRYGKWVQNTLTVVKIGSLVGLMLVGIYGARHATIVENYSKFFSQHPMSHTPESFTAIAFLAPLIAICVAQSGSLFSADSWHNVAFTSEEVQEPRKVLPRALILGATLVVVIYLLVNLIYLCTLSFNDLANAPQDRVATAMLRAVMPHYGGALMSAAIVISTFGCINGLVLAGARAYYAMARDGLFLRSAQKVNRYGVPGWSLALQTFWSVGLLLVNTYSPKTGYGNLYGDLLDYVIAAALFFYILTIAGVIVLRRKRPDLERPYKVPFYPLTPLVYIVGAACILLCLAIYRPATTWPGFVIVACGIPVYFLFRRRAA
ncbi:MAG: amino acid permease [Acidobacteriaceae bacterium]|nr:amino acid permease [Acidobacteriaceae bacterium]